MSILGKIKQNKVVADLTMYKYVIAGRPKSGKTSLVYNVISEKYAGDLSKMLLVAFEKGYNALDGIHAVDIDEWDDFVELTDELVDNKDEVSYKVIALDTVDIASKMATKFILKRLSIRDEATYHSLGDVAWGKAYEELENEMLDQIEKLDKAGYSLMFLTHDKDKTFKTKEGQEYDKTTLSLSGRVRDLILNMVDFIVFVEIEKKKVKGGFEDTRYIYFRGDSSLEAGSRFKNIVEKVEYSPTNFIEAIEDSILEEYGGDSKKVEKAKQEQNEEKEAKADEFVEEEKKNKEVEENEAKEVKELIEAINEEGTKFNATGKRKFKIKVKKVNGGKIDYTKIEDVEVLKDILEHAKSLNN